MKQKILPLRPTVQKIAIEYTPRVPRLPTGINTPRFHPRLFQTHHHSPAWTVGAGGGIDDGAVATMLNMITERRQTAEQMTDEGVLIIGPPDGGLPRVFPLPFLNCFHSSRKRLPNHFFRGLFFRSAGDIKEGEVRVLFD